jgi:hypothetical protein
LAIRNRPICRLATDAAATKYELRRPDADLSGYFQVVTTPSGMYPLQESAMEVLMASRSRSRGLQQDRAGKRLCETAPQISQLRLLEGQASERSELIVVRIAAFAIGAVAILLAIPHNA